MTRTVVVGLDGSPESLAAADWAAREALLRTLPLRLVHVEEADSHPHPLSVPDAGSRQRRQRAPDEVADEVAAGLARRHPALDVAVEHLAGRPAEVLQGTADGTDLLVLGSRGRGALAALLAGSVRLSTVARAACPVVLVRAGPAGTEGTHAPSAEEAPHRDTVLGLDLGKPYDELIAFAFDTAARHGTGLHVVHGWEPPAVYGIHPAALGPRPVDDLTAERAGTLAGVLRPWREEHPEVEVRAEAVVGRPAHRLLEAAAGAFLVAVGRHRRRSPLGHHTGPVVHALVHHCTAPVAVVPHD